MMRLRKWLRALFCVHDWQDARREAYTVIDHARNCEKATFVVVRLLCVKCGATEVRTCMQRNPARKERAQ